MKANLSKISSEVAAALSTGAAGPVTVPASFPAKFYRLFKP